MTPTDTITDTSEVEPTSSPPRAAHDLVAPRGLENVIVTETAIGDVRGREGFFHYRGYSAVELAAERSFEDVWYLLVEGSLPSEVDSEDFARRAAAERELPHGLGDLLPRIVHTGRRLEVLRSAVSLLGAELDWPPLLDLAPAEVEAEMRRLCTLLPVIVATGHLERTGAPRPEPRWDLSLAANYLYLLRGEEAPRDAVRALEQYLVLTIDHGLNASTFTGRVIASTAADLASAICGAIGALSGPLHGGAPSRVLDMFDSIGEQRAIEPWVRDALARGERIMGFGHRIYRGEDPRSAYLHALAKELESPRIEFAEAVEATVVRVLEERYRDRELRANVEFYASIVLESCGIARELFTSTFALARCVGWCANIAEQLADNRLYRPLARYVGPEVRLLPDGSGRHR